MIHKFLPVLIYGVVLECMCSTNASLYNNVKLCGDCDTNPDVFLTTPQIIRRHGYTAEAHTVETDDGYLLTLHRIPANRNGTVGNQPVFLQHGLLSSSADWVDVANLSLAFLLSDLGYDVWLGNARGNFYSKAHMSLSPDSAQFWNFSWHEMGVYDLPAAIYHVSNVTQKGGEIIYIGHSMGTTMFFVFSSILPQVATKIKLMVALAPVAYSTHIKSPIRYIAPWANDAAWLAKYLGFNQFLPNDKMLKFLAYDCELLQINKKICEEVIFIICGFDELQFDESNLPLVLSHAPAGTSTKTVLHYAQEIDHNGDFIQYDYGSDGNLIKYGTSTPPLYNITNIKVPTYLMYGDNDLLATPIDVKRLGRQLTRLAGTYEVPLETFNHVDFLWARDVMKLVYNPLVKIIAQYSGNSVY